MSTYNKGHWKQEGQPNLRSWGNKHLGLIQLQLGQSRRGGLHECRAVSNVWLELKVSQIGDNDIWELLGNILEVA